jgi:hypothetical protein
MLQRSRLTTIICTTLIVVCFTAGVGMAQSGGCTWGGSDFSWSAHFGGSRAADIASAKGGDVYLYISTKLDFILQTWTVTDALQRVATSICTFPTTTTSISRGG